MSVISGIKRAPVWLSVIMTVLAAAGIAAGMVITGDNPSKVLEAVTVEGGDVTRAVDLEIDLNGDGDATDEAVPVAFYEAAYSADLNADGDETDETTDAIDETVSVDLTGNGDTTEAAVTVALYEVSYGVAINADGDTVDELTAGTYDETVDPDLNGDGDSDDASVAVAFYEPFYGGDLDQDDDSDDAITDPTDEMIAVLLVPNGLFVIYNNNTAFIAQGQVQVGDTYMIRPFLKNNSDVDQNLKLLVETPPGFRVDVTAVSGRGTDRVWAITVDDAAARENFDLQISIEVLPQVITDWYELHFITAPFSTTTNFD